MKSTVFYYDIELAFEAIRGHKSAHSFATGPVIAEPKTENKRSYTRLNAESMI